MTKIDFFIELDAFFELIEPIIEKNKLKVFFRRFATTEHEAGWLECSSFSRETASLYNEGGYTYAYLSMTKKPAHSQDWSFLDKAEKELIEMQGGRNLSNAVELTKMRVVGKQSKVNGIFNQIVKKIKEHTVGSEVFYNGYLYKNVFYTDSVKQKKVFYKLGDESFKVTFPNDRE